MSVRGEASEFGGSLCECVKFVVSRYCGGIGLGGFQEAVGCGPWRQVVCCELGGGVLGFFGGFCRGDVLWVDLGDVFGWGCYRFI